MPPGHLAMALAEKGLGMSAVSSHAMARSTTLHGLRGALAFALLLYHVANSGLSRHEGVFWDAIDHVLRSFEHGVELFFCISGVVIVQSFRSSSSVWDFAWNRVTRIYPVLWVTVSVITILSVFRGVPLPSPGVWLANLLALPPLVPVRLIHPAAWSISYEFVFYGMFVLHAVLHRWLPAPWARAALFGLALCLILTHLRALCFVVGVALALSPPSRAPSALRRCMAWPALWLMLALLAWLEAYQRWGMPWNVVYLPELAGGEAAVGSLLILAGTGFAYLGVAGVLLQEGWLARWLQSRHMQWLGTVSFSLYLWQTIVMALVKHGMSVLGITEAVGASAQLCFLALSLVPTLWVSQLSQVWLEKAVTLKLRDASWRKPGIAKFHQEKG